MSDAVAEAIRITEESALYRAGKQAVSVYSHFFRSARDGVSRAQSEILGVLLFAGYASRTGGV